MHSLHRSRQLALRHTSRTTHALKHHAADAASTYHLIDGRKRSVARVEKHKLVRLSSFGHVAMLGGDARGKVSSTAFWTLAKACIAYGWRLTARIFLRGHVQGGMWE